MVRQENGCCDGHDGNAGPTSRSDSRLPKKKLGATTNTYIMYLADNGPEATGSSPAKISVI